MLECVRLRITGGSPIQDGIAKLQLRRRIIPNSPPFLLPRASPFPKAISIASPMTCASQIAKVTFSKFSRSERSDREFHLIECLRQENRKTLRNLNSPVINIIEICKRLFNLFVLSWSSVNSVEQFWEFFVRSLLIPEGYARVVVG